MEHPGLLNGFLPLDGCNCLSASLHRISAFHGYDISEEMLLCLGAGVGFGYFQGRDMLPLIGGRANIHGFHTDLSARTGIELQLHSTSSSRKAQDELIRTLDGGEPFCFYVDMAYLPYLGLGEEAHFGEHAIVAAGRDPHDGTVWVADHDPHMTGFKKGSIYPITLEALARARASHFKPFPPHNRWFVINYQKARQPGREDVLASLRQTCEAMLRPPIRSLGVAGIMNAARQVQALAQTDDTAFLRAALHNFYVYIEVGGTGGGLFRFMYARFLAQAAQIRGLRSLAELGAQMEACGNVWRTAATPLREAFRTDDPAMMAKEFSLALEKASALEMQVWLGLEKVGGDYGAGNSA